MTDTLTDTLAQWERDAEALERLALEHLETETRPETRPDSLTAGQLVKGCKLHGIHAWESASGRVYADSCYADTLEPVELTGYTLPELRDWLGY